VKLEPDFSFALKFKGQIMEAQECHDHALVAYAQAHAIEKDVTTFLGV
jgi:hypothetical protein